jgi:hypothetical protein
VPVFHLYLSV